MSDDLEDYIRDAAGEPEVEQKMIRKILKVIADKRASYPTEISARTGFQVSEVSSLLYSLADADVLEFITAGDQRVKDRASELQKQGKGKIGQVEQMNWVGLNTDIRWSLYDRNTETYYLEREDGRVPDPHPEWSPDNPIRWAADQVNDA